MKLKKFYNYLILFFSIQLFMFTEWLNKYFGKVDFEQIIVFLNFGKRGLLNTEDYIIEKFLQLCFYFPLSLILILNIISFIFKKNFLNEKIFIFFSKNSYKIASLIFIISFIYFFQILEINKKISNSKYSNFIEKNYVFPQLKKIIEKDKKDLLLIYLESFNEEFSSRKRLSQETKDYINFKNIKNYKVNKFYQSTYNNYTIGAIVSSQCGLPQKPIGFLDTRFDTRKTKNVRDVFGLKNFLPKATCLGDILKYNNYKNIFINSIDPKFQAMNIFFKDHGYDKILGKNFFINKGYNYFSSWGGGVNDRILFLEANNFIKKYKSINQNFNMTILTTDTHHPGYRDKDCKINSNDNFSDLDYSISCTSKQLFNFVSDLKKNYGESIKIVIIGDHLNPLSFEKEKNSKGKFIYNRIVNSEVKIFRDEINHYDLFPSILDMLNFPFEYKLGLGFSFLRKYPDFEYNDFKRKLEKNIRFRSKFYYEFWKK